MPSRVIRGEINSSVSLNRVSIGADLTFRALLTAVDDFGRCDARREMLKAALFPVRADAPPDLVMEWVRELEVEGCVQLYEVDGRPYLSMCAWEKHVSRQRRAKASRYPDPPEKELKRQETPPPDLRGSPGISGDLPLGVGVGVGVGDECKVTSVEQVASPPPAIFDPLPSYLESRESATPEKPTLWKAANQLGRHPGPKKQKLAWMYANEDVIVATAIGEVLKAGPMSEQAFNAKIIELMHRYYQWEHVERKPRPPRFESFERQLRRDGDAFWEKLEANGYQWAEA